MQFLGELIALLDSKMQTPGLYGWFHLMFFALSIIVGIFFCSIKNKSDEKTIRRFLIITSLIAIVLEVYKQINYTFSFDGINITADYQWYAFPFQFCSTPMYVGLLAGIIHNKKIHNSLCSYLATFALFAGLCVMFYPAQVFISTIGINIQTMICHGLMITTGIYLFGAGYVKMERKTILNAIYVFVVCVFLAIVMNEIAYYSGLLERETFNMFFISRHCAPSLQVYSLVQAVVPYPWCLIIYVAAFSLASYIIMLLSILIKRIVFFANQRTRLKKA